MSEPTTKTVTVSTVGEALDLYLESNREVIALRRKLAIATDALEGMRFRAACECGEEACKALDAMKGGG